jgi:hypothetical protein
MAPIQFYYADVDLRNTNSTRNEHPPLTICRPNQDSYSTSEQ